MDTSFMKPAEEETAAGLPASPAASWGKTELSKSPVGKTSLPPPLSAQIHPGSALPRLGSSDVRLLS